LVTYTYIILYYINPHVLWYKLTFAKNMSIVISTEANPSNEYRCASGYGGTAVISCYLRGPFPRLTGPVDRGGSALGDHRWSIATVKKKW
jgi:hypothetical protein